MALHPAKIRALQSVARSGKRLPRIDMVNEMMRSGHVDNRGFITEKGRRAAAGRSAGSSSGASSGGS